MIVFVALSNDPATGSPSASFRSVLKTTLTSPIAELSFVAIPASCSLIKELPNLRRASLISPASNAAITSGCTGTSKLDIAETLR